MHIYRESVTEPRLMSENKHSFPFAHYFVSLLQLQAKDLTLSTLCQETTDPY